MSFESNRDELMVNEKPAVGLTKLYWSRIWNSNNNKDDIEG